MRDTLISVSLIFSLNLFASISYAETNAHTQSCDRLAAHPNDTTQTAFAPTSIAELRQHAEEALDACRAAVQTNQPRQFFQLGRTLLAVNQLDEAHSYYIAAAEADHLQATLNLAEHYYFGTYGAQRDLEAAESIYLELMDRDIGHGYLGYGRGIIEGNSSSNDFGMARYALTRAYETIDIACYFLGEERRLDPISGDLNEALSRYNECLDLGVKVPFAHSRIGLIHFLNARLHLRDTARNSEVWSNIFTSLENGNQQDPQSMLIGAATFFYYFDSVVRALSHVSADTNITRQDFDLNVIRNLEEFRRTIPELLIRLEQDFPRSYQAAGPDGDVDDLVSAARQYLLARYDGRQNFSDLLNLSDARGFNHCSRMADDEFSGRYYHITFYNDCDVDIIGIFSFQAEIASSGQQIEEAVDTITIPARTKRELTFHHGELNRQVIVNYSSSICAADRGFADNGCGTRSDALDTYNLRLREDYDIELLKFTSAFDQ